MNYERMVRQYGTRSNLTEIDAKNCVGHMQGPDTASNHPDGLGSGGVDADGNVIEPTGTETALKAELLKKDIGSHSYTDDKETTCRYTVRLGKAELANQNISEQGLFDSDGDLIAYKTFLPKRQG